MSRSIGRRLRTCRFFKPLSGVRFWESYSRSCDSVFLLSLYLDSFESIQNVSAKSPLSLLIFQAIQDGICWNVLIVFNSIEWKHEPPTHHHKQHLISNFVVKMNSRIPQNRALRASIFLHWALPKNSLRFRRSPTTGRRCDADSFKPVHAPLLI